MNVAVHLPTKPENIQALRVRVAEVHAKEITRYLEKLNCPGEQKLHLIKKIQESIDAQKKPD